MRADGKSFTAKGSGPNLSERCPRGGTLARVAAVHVQVSLFPLVAADVDLPRLDARRAFKIEFSRRKILSCACSEGRRIGLQMEVIFGRINEMRVYKMGMLVILSSLNIFVESGHCGGGAYPGACLRP